MIDTKYVGKILRYPVAFIKALSKIFINLTSREIKEEILRKCYSLLNFPDLLGNTNTALSRYTGLLQRSYSRSQWPRGLRAFAHTHRQNRSRVRFWLRMQCK